MPTSDDHVITPRTPIPFTTTTAPALSAAEPTASDPVGTATLLSLTPRWQSRGVVIRVGAYMAGAHLFAAFLFLLFEVGSRHAH